MVEKAAEYILQVMKRKPYLSVSIREEPMLVLLGEMEMLSPDIIEAVKKINKENKKVVEMLEQKMKKKNSRRKKLAISGRIWKKIPSFISQFDWIQELCLENNNLEQVGDEIFSLKSLRKFVASGNKIKQLSPLIGNLPSLTTLDLSANLLEKFPTSPFYSLRSLSLSDNKFSFIMVAKLTLLETLNLSNNKLVDLPFGSHFLTKLKSLELAGNQIAFQVEQRMEELRRNEHKWRRIKCMLLGKEASGKVCSIFHSGHIFFDQNAKRQASSNFSGALERSTMSRLTE